MLGPYAKGEDPMSESARKGELTSPDTKMDPSFSPVSVSQHCLQDVGLQLKLDLQPSPLLLSSAESK